MTSGPPPSHEELDHNFTTAILLDSAVDCATLARSLFAGRLKISGYPRGEGHSYYETRRSDFDELKDVGTASRALVCQTIANAWRFRRALNFKSQDWLLESNKRKQILQELEFLERPRDVLEHGYDTHPKTRSQPVMYAMGSGMLDDTAMLIEGDDALIGPIRLSEVQTLLERYQEWIGLMAVNHKKDFVKKGLDWRDVKLERKRGYLRFPYEDWE